jgi:Zn-dependent peptidase ImmA (M78 family)
LYIDPNQSTVRYSPWLYPTNQQWDIHHEYQHITLYIDLNQSTVRYSPWVYPTNQQWDIHHEYQHITLYIDLNQSTVRYLVSSDIWGFLSTVVCRET